MSKRDRFWQILMDYWSSHDVLKSPPVAKKYKIPYILKCKKWVIGANSKIIRRFQTEEETINFKRPFFTICTESVKILSLPANFKISLFNAV